MNKIAIDVRKYYDFGIGTYIRDLLKFYDNIEDFEFNYFANSSQIEKLKNIHKGKFIVNNSEKYSISELFSFSKKIKNNNINLFHSPHYTLPYNIKSNVVTTIHDIIHLRFSKYFPLYKRLYAERMILHAYNRSDLILVNSNFTKNDLLNYFKFDESKIEVIHLGIEKTEADKTIDIKRKYGINKDYLLYVGSFKPHKNLPFLVNALNKIKFKNDLQFIFIGENIENNSELNNLLNKLNIDAKFIGYVLPNELSLFYKNAKLFIFPSLYEGFGYPILEAMINGTPVIASNVTSIPEICGNAAVLFNPKNEENLIYEIEKLLIDDEKRKNLIKLGFENAKKYSSSKFANKTLESYKKLLK